MGSLGDGSSPKVDSSPVLNGSLLASESVHNQLFLQGQHFILSFLVAINSRKLHIRQTWLLPGKSIRQQ